MLMHLVTAESTTLTSATHVPKDLTLKQPLLITVRHLSPKIPGKRLTPTPRNRPKPDL
jgi:hypothetical protein